LRVEAGLRGLVVSRGALEVWQPHCLQALAFQARAAAEPGWLFVGTGAAPLWGVAWASVFVSRLGLLLALSAGSALVAPFWIWSDGFTRVAGRAFGIVLVTILGCLLIASGVTVWGVGLLTGWALAEALRRLLAWEADRVAMRADRAVVRAGLGAPLLEALEVLRGMGAPVAPRVAALKAALAETSA
jgi:hypothetical protein